MTRRQWIGFWLLTASAVPSSRAIGDSIWDRRDQRSGYLFIDNKARRVGDVLFVTVNESNAANNTEQRKMQKDTAASAKFDFAGKATGGSTSAAAASGSVDQSSDRSFNGSAQYQSNRQLLDDMSVTVIDILPNGNLVVEGSRYRGVSNETRLLRVSGIVRPNDIIIPNNISSQNIAAIKIIYEGGGVESRFTNQGWLGRTTNKLWPF